MTSYQLLIYALLAVDASLLTVVNYRYKDGRWLLPVMFAVCNILTLLWVLLLRTLSGDRQVFVAGLIWDVILTATAVAIPLAFYQVKADWRFLGGLALVVAGLVLLKWH